MKIRLDKDPVVSYFTYLDSFIGDNYKDSETSDMDDIYRRILSLNDHDVANAKVIEREILPNNELVISFVFNAKCNNKTMCYDIIHMYGVTNIFIFADYFSGLYENKDSDAMNLIAKEIMGRSVYYEALKKISYIILDYIYPFKSDNLSMAGFKYHQRYPLYIAAKVLDNLEPLSISDIDSEIIMKPEDLMRDIKSKNINSLILGIE